VIAHEQTLAELLNEFDFSSGCDQSAGHISAAACLAREFGQVSSVKLVFLSIVVLKSGKSAL
jgi:hypothetical protein